MGIIAVDASQVNVTNTTTETTIFTGTVPENTIGIDKWVVLKILAQCNAAGLGGITLRVKFGGTTYYQDANILGPSALGPEWYVFPLCGNNATNAQTLGGIALSGSAGGATTGIGDIGTDEIDAITPILNDGVAIDQTADRAFAVTIQWDIAATNNAFEKFYGVIYDMTDVAAVPTSLIFPRKDRLVFTQQYAYGGY